MPIECLKGTIIINNVVTNKKCGYANLQNLETAVAGDQTKELKFKTRRRRNLKEKRFPNPHDLRRKEKF